jgi:hypothetical protein
MVQNCVIERRLQFLSLCRVVDRKMMEQNGESWSSGKMVKIRKTEILGVKPPISNLSTKMCHVQLSPNKPESHCKKFPAFVLDLQS